MNKKPRVKTSFIGNDATAFNSRKAVFEKKGKEFDIVLTSAGRQIKLYEDGVQRHKYVYCNSRYGVLELQMFQEMKKEVRQNILKKKLIVPPYTKKDVDYFRFSKTLRAVGPGENLTVKNCLELDIKMAYYITAFQLGYISLDFFKACENLPKYQRLRLIGSIATSKTILKFRDGKYQDPIRKKDDQLRHVWFHICRQVDQCLQECAWMLEERFLFYWVDGIYIGGSNVPYGTMAYIFKEYKYKFTPLEIKKIDISCDMDNILMMNIHKANGDTKPFHMQKDYSAYKKALIEKNRLLLESLNDRT